MSTATTNYDLILDGLALVESFSTDDPEATESILDTIDPDQALLSVLMSVKIVNDVLDRMPGTLRSDAVHEVRARVIRERSRLGGPGNF